MTDAEGHSSDDGLVIFVESIRWLGVRWGLGPLRRGLRMAGVDAEVLYWRWHETWRGCLVLPALMDRRMLDAQASRLAEFLTDLRREGPNRPIHLMGYSCGAFVALRAMEMLPSGVRVDSAVLFAGAFDPYHDLTAALAHIRGKLVVCVSKLDFLILGVGTSLFGTGDRSYGPAAGMVGLRHSSAQNPRVAQIHWRPAMTACGYFGGHFTAAASRFFAQQIAPLLA